MSSLSADCLEVGVKRAPAFAIHLRTAAEGGGTFNKASGLWDAAESTGLAALQLWRNIESVPNRDFAQAPVASLGILQPFACLTATVTQLVGPQCRFLQGSSDSPLVQSESGDHRPAYRILTRH